MALYLLLVMLTVCAAVPQDLSGKMFTFPEETDSAHVRLTTSRQVQSAVTVCLRAFTDLRRGYSLFSLATPSAPNEVLIWKVPVMDEYHIWIRNNYVKLRGQDYKLNTWQSVCSTWDSASGIAQLWLDGKPSTRKSLSTGSHISSPVKIVLGQEQDSHGGAFDINQSFVGMLSDVHMWDYVLSPCEIQAYAAHMNFPSGNVLNWRALEFQKVGKVVIEDVDSCH